MKRQQVAMVFALFSISLALHLAGSPRPRIDLHDVAWGIGGFALALSFCWARRVKQ